MESDTTLLLGRGMLRGDLVFHVLRRILTRFRSRDRETHPPLLATTLGRLVEVAASTKVAPLVDIVFGNLADFDQSINLGDLLSTSMVITIQKMRRREASGEGKWENYVRGRYWIGSP